MSKNLRGHVTLATPPFGKISKGQVRTVLGNMHVKFEVRSFNRFQLVWLTGPLRTDTDTHGTQMLSPPFTHSLDADNDSYFQAVFNSWVIHAAYMQYSAQ